MSEIRTETEPAVSAKIKKPSKIRWVILAILIAGLTWAAVDLYAPRSSQLKQFDANEVARLETAMWRSYYQRERLKLFNELTELLRTQYNLPLLRSNLVAYQASKAAFVFKDGRNRSDYEKALPNLVNFYSEIRKVSDIAFDVNRAAQLELEWWIVHRERRKHAPGDLDRALAELPAELYQLPVEPLMEHARLRAEAMTIRDDRAEAGGVSEADWQRIEDLLRQSWRSLSKAVNSPA
jgi:transposase-like protein